MAELSLRADLARYAWDLEHMPARYGVSWEVLVRRLVHVTGAIVSIWDQGKLSRRWRSPWLHANGWRQQLAPAWEAEFAGSCRGYECHLVEDDGLVRAYYVARDGWRRVVVVSELEAWEARSTGAHGAEGTRWTAPGFAR